MSKDLKVTKDLSWVKISQDENRRNVFNVTFDIPNRRFSAREPLPKNTGICCQLPRIWFSCVITDFDQSRKTLLGNPPLFVDPKIQEIYASFKRQMERKLKGISGITDCVIAYIREPLSVGNERVALHIGMPFDDVKLPTNVRMYFHCWLYAHFDPPLDSSEAERLLSEVAEVYSQQAVPEISRLVCEYFTERGFVVGNCETLLGHKPKGSPFHNTWFCYFPRKLDEWERSKRTTAEFAVILPESEEVVNLFTNLISSCQTIGDLYKSVPFLIGVFQDGARVLLRVPPWDDSMFWFLRREVEVHRIEDFLQVLPPKANDYLHFYTILTWVRKVVEEDKPSQTD